MVTMTRTMVGSIQVGEALIQKLMQLLDRVQHGSLQAYGIQAYNVVGGVPPQLLQLGAYFTEQLLELQVEVSVQAAQNFLQVVLQLIYLCAERRLEMADPHLDVNPHPIVEAADDGVALCDEGAAEMQTEP